MASLGFIGFQVMLCALLTTAVAYRRRKHRHKERYSLHREKLERERLGAAHFVDLFGLKPAKKEDLRKESEEDELGIKPRRHAYKGANVEIFTPFDVKMISIS